MAKRATRQAVTERADALQRRGKRKVGERADAEAGVTAGVAPISCQKVTVPIPAEAVIAVPVPPPRVETVRSSGGLASGTVSQLSTASERP